MRCSSANGQAQYLRKAHLLCGITRCTSHWTCRLIWRQSRQIQACAACMLRCCPVCLLCLQYEMLLPAKSMGKPCQREMVEDGQGALCLNAFTQCQEVLTCTPPTVAGPRRILLFARAYAISFLVSASGTPSAMTATTRIVGCFIASMLDSYALCIQAACQKCLS